MCSITVQEIGTGTGGLGEKEYSLGSGNNAKKMPCFAAGHFKVMNLWLITGQHSLRQGL